jgi:DNA-binding response OmpR family regulator
LHGKTLVMRVLLVEDDDDLRVLTAEGLSRRGCTVDTARTIDQAEDALRVAPYDVLLVDRGLPDGDGIKLSGMSRVPVIFTTALGDVRDRVEGLNNGADDYVVKPFDLDELAARIRAAARKPGTRQPPRFSLGGLMFDDGHQEAWISGNRLGLGRRETALLALLISEAPRTVTRDRIEERLYSFDEPVTPNAVEALVSRLRRRIEPAGLAITAARGIGWRLEEA